MIRRTKILATLGPASRSPEVLDALLAAGLDAVRLNFSHGDQAQHAETYARVRAAAERAGREIAVLQDLQGPKIRLGKLEKPITVKPGSRLVITPREISGSEDTVTTDYAALAGDVKVGMQILMDEGRVSALVRAIEGDDVITEIVDGGVLASNKGLNVPGAALTASSMTDKDRDDVKFGLALGVDFVALSFVRRPRDVEDLRLFMAQQGRVVPIIAKIEKQQAVDAIDEIVAISDGVMVARGDLAIEAKLDMIPAHQKRIIERANHAGKLVITATQMLESMTENALPTRAEVTDVANAILDGTDAVMLSGETAVGKYPAGAVQRMASIAQATEQSLYRFGRPVRAQPSGPFALDETTARIAAEAARESRAKVLVVFTESGDTARLVSDDRPEARILALTPSLDTQRRLGLYWGVHAFQVPLGSTTESLMSAAEAFVVDREWAVPGEIVVLVLGTNLVPGADHTITLRRLLG